MFEQSVKFYFPPSGDLINKMYVNITLPKLSDYKNTIKDKKLKTVKPKKKEKLTFVTIDKFFETDKIKDTPDVIEI